jgi:hypothetical protein
MQVLDIGMCSSIAASVDGAAPVVADARRSVNRTAELLDIRTWCVPVKTIARNFPVLSEQAECTRQYGDRHRSATTGAQFSSTHSKGTSIAILYVGIDS